MLKPDQAQKMQSLRNGGWTIRKIAMHFGVSDKCVRDYLTIGRRYEDLRIAVTIVKKPLQTDEQISKTLRVPPARVSEMRTMLRRLG